MYLSRLSSCTAKAREPALHIASFGRRVVTNLTSALLLQGDCDPVPDAAGRAVPAASAGGGVGVGAAAADFRGGAVGHDAPARAASGGCDGSGGDIYLSFSHMCC